jgi:nifR3 family TIM-barrel protein
VAVTVMSLTIGPLPVDPPVVLAPMAGVTNSAFRTLCRSYGAGLYVSEMVSARALVEGNDKTNRMLTFGPDEDVRSIQLYGVDPDVIGRAVDILLDHGVHHVDLNMGCPVPKVCKTGAGAALLGDPQRAVELARAAVEGASAGERKLPVTVKLRSGLRVGETSGFDLAHRLVADAGVAAIAFHPRSAAVQHKGVPDYALAARLVESLDAPVILTGGLSDAAHVGEAFEQTGAEAVMLARGALGNPWLFAELVHGRAAAPTRAEVVEELDWTIACAVEHLGETRATRYLRKFYPWYIARLELDVHDAKRLQAALQQSETLTAVRTLLQEHTTPLAVAV